ncbi:hypothetical protein Syun_005246 [Stephania yunnanensis]|uniref:Prolyl endopeptidase n=1 Tax=Stephania yunnanensis TaxID=152371 RepID=A0AAP0L828_9MAGN
MRPRIFSNPSFQFLRFAHSKPSPRTPKPPPPPTPPKPPQKPVSFTLHGHTWEDPYNWMSCLNDKVAMRHMDVYMEQEDKYTEAVMADTERLQRKLQSEMASRMASHLSSPPLRWGPWLYYRRIEEGKQYPVLCRRSADLNEEFVSFNSPSAGFDFTAGKRIEQKLLDYNQEAERFGGYSYEELSEVSPDHRFLAYTMYNKDNDSFRLSVRDLSSGSLCSKPDVERVANLAWTKNGQALLYTMTNKDKRPNRIFYISSKVYLINAMDPLSGMTLVWESEPQSHCIVEHHRGCLYLFTDADKEGEPVNSHYLLRCPVETSASKSWEAVFLDDSDFTLEDVDFIDTHMVFILREGQKYDICSVSLPLPNVTGAVRLKDLNPKFLPLPKYVSQISPGPNYDYYSSTVRFTISSPVMPDAVVDYNLTNGKWFIVQQQNLLHERTKILYGSGSSTSSEKTQQSEKLFSSLPADYEMESLWNELSEFYTCESYNVSSHDEVVVPLTIVYSCKSKQMGQNPGLLHGHGAYGELLDKRWRSELKSLLDRGWVIAYADVRGGGGGGKRWHQDGIRTKKQNSVNDYISCAKFLIEKEIVQHDKLAGWGYSAGGLLVASAINSQPDLFRAAVLKVPFLDPVNTLYRPILPLTPIDYEEFGYPEDLEDFHSIQKYSPYDNIQKDALYPAVLITSSFTTRFGVWEAAKWGARVRERTFCDPKRPILLNLTTDIVEENKYLQCKESALETAFLIKMMDS